jgi:hypothetical protein
VCMRIVLTSVLLLLFSACAPEAEYASPSGAQRIDFAVPRALCNKKIDLDNEKEVADALGMKLNGDSKQHLYDITMMAPSTGGTQTRIIPIRVDNLTQGRDIIYSLQ